MKKRPAVSTTCTSALISLAAAASVSAQEGCFARAYDEAHLASHPDQVVRELRIFFTADAGRPGTRYADITARMTWQGHARRQGVGGMTLEEFALCGADGTCAIACDGGTFRISAFDGDGVEIETQDARLSAQPCTDGVVSTLAEVPGSVTTYHLRAAADAVCGR